MKKLKITEKDYLKAHRKASREEELARHGRPLRYRAVHVSGRIYNRKKQKAGLKDLPFFMRETLSPFASGWNTKVTGFECQVCCFRR